MAMALRKVQVVYYLSRGGQLEQPHLLELTVSSSEGVTLRDVKHQLAMMRGGGIASSFSWSYKRSYKNGYVWQDISDNDLVFPAHGCEYILKGSEIVAASAMNDLHEDGRGGDDPTTPGYRKEAHRRAKSCSIQTESALESQFRSSCNVNTKLLQDRADEKARPKLLLISNGTDLAKTMSGSNNNLTTQTVARVVENSTWKQGGPQHLHRSRSKRNRHSTDFEHNSNNDTSTTSHSSLSSSSSNNLTAVVSNQTLREYKMIARDDIHAGAAEGATPFCSARYDFSSIKGEIDPDQTPVSSHGGGADYHLQGYETPVSGPLGNLVNNGSNIRPKTKHPFTSSGLFHLVSCAGVGLDIKADMIPLSLCLCSGNNNEDNKRSGRTSQADDNRSSMSDTMSDSRVNIDKSSSNTRNRPWYKSYKRSFLKAPTTSSCLQTSDNSAQEEIQIDCPTDSSSSEVSRELVEDSSESCSQTATTTALRLKLGSARSAVPGKYSPSCYRAKQQQQEASDGERENNNNQRTATLWERLAASKREYDSIARDERKQRAERSQEFAKDGWDLHQNAVVDPSPPFNDPC